MKAHLVWVEESGAKTLVTGFVSAPLAYEHAERCAEVAARLGRYSLGPVRGRKVTKIETEDGPIYMVYKRDDWQSQSAESGEFVESWIEIVRYTVSVVEIHGDAVTALGATIE